MSTYFDEAKAMYMDLVSWRRTVHQNPEVGMKLPETTAFVVAKLTEFPEAVIKYKRLSPMGAENVCDTTGKPSNPLLATHCVPTQPEVIASPTTAPQSAEAFERHMVALASEMMMKANPIVVPIALTGRPEAVETAVGMLGVLRAGIPAPKIQILRYAKGPLMVI